MYGFTQIPVLSSSSSSPVFRFARTNGLGGSSYSAVNGTTATKDGIIYNMRFLTSSNIFLKRRMSDLYQYGH